MNVTKRIWVRSLLSAAAVTALVGTAWSQGQPVKIGLLATRTVCMCSSSSGGMPSGRSTRV